MDVTALVRREFVYLDHFDDSSGLMHDLEMTRRCQRAQRIGPSAISDMFGPQSEILHRLCWQIYRATVTLVNNSSALLGVPFSFAQQTVNKLLNVAHTTALNLIIQIVR